MVSYRLTVKQRNAVWNKSENGRREYCINKMHEEPQIWGARNSKDWFLEFAPEGYEYFPVWPHPSLADFSLNANFKDYTAELITQEEWLYNWLPLFESRNIAVALVPNENWEFSCIEARALKKSLMNKLARLA